MDKKAKIALIGALFLVCILVVAIAIAKPGRKGPKACNDKTDNDGDGYGANYCTGDIVNKDYFDYYCTGGACDPERGTG